MSIHRDTLLDEIRAALNVTLAPLPPALRARPVTLRPVPVRIRALHRPGLLAELDRAGHLV